MPQENWTFSIAFSKGFRAWFVFRDNTDDKISENYVIFEINDRLIHSCRPIALPLEVLYLKVGKESLQSPKRAAARSVFK